MQKKYLSNRRKKDILVKNVKIKNRGVDCAYRLNIKRVNIFKKIFDFIELDFKR